MKLHELLKASSDLKAKYADARFKYKSYESLALTYGWSMRAASEQPLQKGIKQCFYNCYESAAESSLGGAAYIYVEGYALSPTTKDLVVDHAWLLNPQGEVVDPTWRTPGLEYIGIPFPTLWLYGLIERRRQSVINYLTLAVLGGNYLEDFSLLRSGLPFEVLDFVNNLRSKYVDVH